MALTRLDCDFYRPVAARGDFSSYVALGLPALPGVLVMAGSAAARAGMGSQIACRLALDRFVEGVLRVDGEGRGPDKLQAGFRGANRGVYEYSHKMAAAGRMVASLFGLVIEGGQAASARVGQWSAYLVRSRRLFPFFEPPGAAGARVRESLIGAQSLITLETASCPVEGRDRIFVFSAALSQEQEIALAEECGEETDRPRFGEEFFLQDEEPALIMIASIGPEALYLDCRVA